MLPLAISFLFTICIIESIIHGGTAAEQPLLSGTNDHVSLRGYAADALQEDDIEPETENRLQAFLKRRKRYVVRKKRWRSNLLTWRLDKANVKDEDEYVVRTTLHRAFQEWSSVANVRFDEINDGLADIVVGFERGKHNDDFPFDGKDGIVAHAFYPRDGRLHFDADEDWSLNSPTGVNLYQTAVHEIGHILGLEHSVDPQAVMFSARRPYDPDFALGDDDVRAVRALFPFEDDMEEREQKKKYYYEKESSGDRDPTLSQVVENLELEPLEKERKIREDELTFPFPLPFFQPR